MNMFERRDDSELHSYIILCGALLLQTNTTYCCKQTTPKSLFLATFRVSMLSGKISTNKFLWRKNPFFPNPQLYAQLSKKYSGVQERPNQFCHFWNRKKVEKVYDNLVCPSKTINLNFILIQRYNNTAWSGILIIYQMPSFEVKMQLDYHLGLKTIKKNSV